MILTADKKMDTAEDSVQKKTAVNPRIKSGEPFSVLRPFFNSDEAIQLVLRYRLDLLNGAIEEARPFFNDDSQVGAWLLTPLAALGELTPIHWLSLQSEPDPVTLAAVLVDTLPRLPQAPLGHQAI